MVALWLASRPDAAYQQMPEMVRFKQGEITSITLARAGSPTLSLVRKDGQWYLSEEGALGTDGRAAAEAAVEAPVEADEEAVEHLLHDLATMEIVRVVTRNPEQYEKLKVTAGSTGVLLTRDGEIVLELYVGKQGGDILSTYLRVNDWPEVVAVNKSLLWQVNRPFDGWRANEGVVMPAKDREKQ